VESTVHDYEGLVRCTAAKYYLRLGMEFEDLAQELRLKCWRAKERYDPSRSKQTEKAFVFSCMTNFIVDLTRQSIRRKNGNLTEVPMPGDSEDLGVGASCAHDEVYGGVDSSDFQMPSTVSQRERVLIFLLTLGYSQTEVARMMELELKDVERSVRKLRAKLADWRPSSTPVREAVAA
jgi:RNA polymerase sigma factor (sigma-70 family)